MWKFRTFQSKTEGMAASVRIFFEHVTYTATSQNIDKDDTHKVSQSIHLIYQ